MSDAYDPVRSRNRSLILGGLLVGVVLGAGLGMPVVTILIHTRQGNRARDEISAALGEKYPDIRFRAGMSYTNPTVCVTVSDVDDPEKQRDIAQWLRDFKTTRKVGPEIRLTFGEKDWNDPEVIWIR
jgi:hypothetical protein